MKTKFNLEVEFNTNEEAMEAFNSLTPELQHSIRERMYVTQQRWPGRLLSFGLDMSRDKDAVPEFYIQVWGESGKVIFHLQLVVDHSGKFYNSYS